MQSSLPFTLSNIENSFTSLLEMKAYQEATSIQKHEMIKMELSCYKNLIIKQINNTSLVHLQFGHPLGQLSKQAAFLIQKNVQEQQPEFNTLIVNQNTGQILSTFDLIIPIIPYEKNQKQLVIDNIYDLPQHKVNINAYWIPYGLTFQCLFSDEHWVFTSQSIVRLNESSFGGPESLQSLFSKILGKKNVSFDTLNKNNVYTFHVAISNFSLIPIEEDQIYIYNVKEAYTGQEVDDPIWDKIPSLLSNTIRINNTKEKGLVHNILFGKNSWFEYYKSQFNLPVPMQSMLLEINGNTFEIQTPVKELVINFNVHRRTDGIKQDTASQLRDYIKDQLNLNSNNSYIQSYLSKQ